MRAQFSSSIDVAGCRLISVKSKRSRELQVLYMYGEHLSLDFILWGHIQDTSTIDSDHGHVSVP